MNRLILLGIFTYSLILCSYKVSAQNTTQLSTEKVYYNKLMFSKSEIRFLGKQSKIDFSEKVEVTNVSKKSLSIKEITQDCGCFQVSFTKKLIKPGEKTILIYTFKNPPPGEIRKKSFIFFNGISEPVPLYIRGTII